MLATTGGSARRCAVAFLVAAAGLAGGCDARRSPAATAATEGDVCTRCHGDPASTAPAPDNAAPPRSMHGETSTSAVAVGAHRQHLAGGRVSGGVACDDCHEVPSTSDPLAHVGRSDRAKLTWSAFARANRASPSWDRASATCSGVYCHGATLHGGSVAAPQWTRVDGSQLSCSSCHGAPPPYPFHPRARPGSGLEACASCHPDTVLPDGQIDLAGGNHIDGFVEVVGGGACGACHGVPPRTGAHVVHYGDLSMPPLATYGDVRVLEDYRPLGAPYYMFGCGNCHPLDPARHLDGVVEVELASALATAGSPKALAPPSAAYVKVPGDPVGHCANVYCHSSGQAAPAFVASPRWDWRGRLRCSGCHRDPPSYPTGGAGTPTANSHVSVTSDGWVFGHFAGLHGPSSGSLHGGTFGASDAAPITCQACHFATVDPANTGPSGFYYLDTEGDYALVDPVTGRPAMLNDACARCHTGQPGAPAIGAGKVLPLRHVNGTRDVDFDPRTTIPGTIAWLPKPPNTPTRPYWVTPAAPPGALPAGSGLNGVTWSFTLAGASYEPATKTCSNVACHLTEQPVWGGPYSNAGANPCLRCHPV